MFIWPSVLQHTGFSNGTKQCTIIARMRKVAEIGIREKIDAVHRSGVTPCAGDDKAFDPVVGKDGKSDGVVYKIRWRNGMHEQLQTS